MNGGGLQNRRLHERRLTDRRLRSRTRGDLRQWHGWLHLRAPSGLQRVFQRPEESPRRRLCRRPPVRVRHVAPSSLAAQLPSLVYTKRAALPDRCHLTDTVALVGSGYLSPRFAATEWLTAATNRSAQHQQCGEALHSATFVMQLERRDTIGPEQVRAGKNSPDGGIEGPEQPGALTSRAQPQGSRHAVMTHVMALQAGSELVGDFRIERVLGAGGFGITYLADELALARKVTIKEYFPADFAARERGSRAVPRSDNCRGDYDWGLERFMGEAQTLARFDHRNIVRVYRYFRANNTGYMVLHFEEGRSLKAWLASLGRAPRQKELDDVLGPVLDALETVHAADYLHRDIAPDNIIIRTDGSPVLIDFGSARGDIARHSRTMSALIKPGYSPYEQYAEKGSRQGPWSDLYALAATIYFAITGKRPPDSPSRVVKDDMAPASEAAVGAYRRGFLKALDRALALKIERRPQTVAEFRDELLSPEPQRRSWFADNRRANAPSEPASAATVGEPPIALALPADTAHAGTGGTGTDTSSELRVLLR